jgi:SAM-dependent methyltransferase
MSRDASSVPLIVQSKSRKFAREIGALDRRLSDFYARNVAYYDCAASSDKKLLFEPVRDLVELILTHRPRVRIIEIGAGKTELPQFLAERIPDKHVDFVAHDINDTNREFYQEKGIPLLVKPLSELTGIEPFDIVVSFFTFEHMTRPAESIDMMLSLLRPDGRLIIVCPKYTCPFYIPPAIRHLGRFQQICLNLRLVAASLMTHLTHQAKFYVVIEPAVFHAEWRRDSDAVHMVSQADLEAHLGREWRVDRLAIKHPSAKHRILNSLMMMSIVAERHKLTSA